MNIYGYTNSKNGIRLETVLTKGEALVHFMTYYILKVNTKPKNLKKREKIMKHASSTNSIVDYCLKPFVDIIEREDNLQFLILTDYLRMKNKQGGLLEFLQKVKTIIMDESIKKFFVIISEDISDEIFEDFRKEIELSKTDSPLGVQNKGRIFPVVYAMFIK